MAHQHVHPMRAHHMSVEFKCACRCTREPHHSHVPTIGSASLACVGSLEENNFLRNILVPGRVLAHSHPMPIHTPH